MTSGPTQLTQTEAQNADSGSSKEEMDELDSSFVFACMQARQQFPGDLIAFLVIVSRVSLTGTE